MLHAMMRELELSWRVLRSLGRVVGWLAGTMWDGAVTIVRAVRAIRRFPRAFEVSLACPRGHVSPVFGVYRCSCGALHEGWAFDCCRICGHSAGWTPCLMCGLPIKNPLPE